MKQLLWIGLVLASSAGLAQDVKYNYDREVDFAVYKTFQWNEAHGAEIDPFRDRDIRRAVESQLARRGLRRVDRDGDLRVAYHTQLDQRRQLDAWGMGPRWSAMGRATVNTVEIGTLVLDLYDARQNQLIWRGSVTKSITAGKDPDKNYKKLESAVGKLLKAYPPK